MSATTATATTPTADTWPIGAAAVSGAVTAAVEAMTATGRAEVGDKTMMDAAVPFARTLSQRVQAGDELQHAWAAAVSVAQDAADGTADLVPRKGRARTHGQKSVGHPDPGAMSFVEVVSAASREE